MRYCQNATCQQTNPQPVSNFYSGSSNTCKPCKNHKNKLAQERNSSFAKSIFTHLLHQTHTQQDAVNAAYLQSIADAAWGNRERV